jgi:hypothetical protein
VLVYHDWKCETELEAALDACASVLAETDPDIDGLRTQLIVCGQLEQAVEDAVAHAGTENKGEASLLARGLTDTAALSFHRRWMGAKKEEIAPYLARARKYLFELHRFGSLRVTIKVPEGFAFYALFPEQYAVAVAHWAADHRALQQKRVLVVGVRSIGTTLSAVVRASLEALAWRAERITLRPHGDPFQRQIKQPLLPSGIADCALVVDEGPGLSGSSMAAVAEYLEGSGIRNVSFLPGHRNEPGSAASSQTKHWWRKTPRYFAQLGDLRWQGRSLQEELAEASRAWCGPVAKVEDLSGGSWRARAFASEEDWPSVVPMLERAKILCVGSRRSILWKFAGFGSLSSGMQKGSREQTDKAEELVRAGFSAETLGMRLGFKAVEWLEGKRLSPADARKPEILQHLIGYIVAAAKSCSSSWELMEGIERLATMLYCNVKKILNDDWAKRAIAEKSAAQSSISTLAYGDGRLAPHEWVRVKSGRILKTDNSGHIRDHTLVGEQSVLWDIAGAIVEWAMDEAQTEFFLHRFEQIGIQTESAAIRFYRKAYAAFRMGVCSLGAQQSGNDELEARRLGRAALRYEQQLLNLLQSSEVESRQTRTPIAQVQD